MKLSCTFLLIFTISSCCFKFSVCLWPNFRFLSQNSLLPSPSPSPAREAAGPSPSAAPEAAPPSAAPEAAPTIAAPEAAPPPSHIFKKDAPGSMETINVMSFGAIGDGVTDDTQAFKMAWDSACQSNSAILLVPNSYTFMVQSTIFTGPCKSGIVFQIDGTIMPPDGPNLWPKTISKRQWLVFYRINGMLMQGGGVIDGRGEKWWNLPCKPHRGVKGKTAPGPCDSPVAMRFFMSSNLSVKGLEIKNSPQFHIRFDNCRGINIDTIQIKAPALSPNTDGIHVENTNDVKIYNSVVSNGDDCVSIGAGSYNVYIRNITCGPSHGISIGSLGNKKSRACVSDITVTDSVIKNSDNGVRIKTWQGGSGSLSKVTFNNIRMENVRNPIMIDQYYCLSKRCMNQSSAVFISNVLYQNIKGTYDTRSAPLHLACSDTLPCMNITLSDVDLLPAIGGKHIVLDPFCWNAYGALKTPTIPPVFCLLGGNPKSSQENNVDGC
ncbi:hypothetical protein LguiB_006423 [Lonicera macranthoides]